MAVLVLVLMLGAVFLVLRAKARTLKRAEEQWARAAKKFGFKVSPDFLLSARIGQTRIGVSRSVSDEKSYMSVVIDGKGDIPAAIALKSEAPLGLSKLVSGPDATIGDSYFDSEIYASGPEPLLLALLDEPCRALLLNIFKTWSDAELYDARLEYTLPCPDDELDIARGIERAILFARSLAIQSGEVAERLAANARGTDQAEVRLRNLRALAQLPDGKDRAQAVTLDLLRDPQPEMRIEAARRLASSELTRVLELAESERDAGVCIELLGLLAESAGERLWPTITEALGSPVEAVQRAAADAARATNYIELAPRIAEQVTHHLDTADPETLVSLAGALRALADPTTEGALVDLLRHDSKDVQRAAALALAELGSVAAVQPLLDCSDKLLLAGETKNAVLTAVTRIQARLGNVEAGALSVVEHSEHAGALSLPDETDQDGALSLVDASERLKRN